MFFDVPATNFESPATVFDVPDTILYVPATVFEPMGIDFKGIYKHEQNPARPNGKKSCFIKL